MNYSIRKICMAMGCAAAMMAQVHAGTMKETFRSPDLPDLPYSAAVKVGDTIYVSGVTGHVRGGTSPVPGGVRAEAEQALTYIDEILGMAGSSMEKVVKCTVLLADIQGFPQMNEAYRKFFPKNPPARSTIIVPILPNNSLVEIECNATT